MSGGDGSARGYGGDGGNGGGSVGAEEGRGENAKRGLGAPTKGRGLIRSGTKVGLAIMDAQGILTPAARNSSSGSLMSIIHGGGRDPRCAGSSPQRARQGSRCSSGRGSAGSDVLARGRMPLLLLGPCSEHQLRPTSRGWHDPRCRHRSLRSCELCLLLRLGELPRTCGHSGSLLRFQLCGGGSLRLVLSLGLCDCQGRIVLHP